MFASNAPAHFDFDTPPESPVDWEPYFSFPSISVMSAYFNSTIARDNSCKNLVDVNPDVLGLGVCAVAFMTHHEGANAFPCSGIGSSYNACTFYPCCRNHIVHFITSPDLPSRYRSNAVTQRFGQGWYYSFIPSESWLTVSSRVCIRFAEYYTARFSLNSSPA